MQGFEAKKQHAIESNGLSVGPQSLKRSHVIGFVFTGVTVGPKGVFPGKPFKCAIPVSCAAIGFLAGLPRRERWQVGVAIFLSASATFSGNLLLWWIGHGR